MNSEDGDPKRVMKREGEIAAGCTYDQNMVDYQEKLLIKSIMAKAVAKSKSAKKQVSLLTKLRRIAEKIPASELAKIPPDASRNYKHYLYGHPKK